MGAHFDTTVFSKFPNFDDYNPLVSVETSAIHRIYGNSGKAQDFLVRALKYSEHIGDIATQIYTLYELVQLFVQMNDMDAARELYPKISDLQAKYDDIALIEDFDKISLATILRNSDDITEKADAGKIFMSLHNAPLQEIKLNAMALSIELLIDAYYVYRDEYTLDQIQKLIYKIDTYYEGKTEYYFDTYIYRARVLVIHGKLIDAHNLLEELCQKASEYNQGFLHIKGRIEQLKVREEFQRIAEIYHSNIDMVSDVTGMIDQQPSQLQLKEDHEFPILLLVLDEAGIIRLEYKFTAEIDLDSNMLGSLISAISAFASTALGVESKLDKIQYQDFELLIKSSGRFQYCYIYRGSNLYVSRKLQTFEQFISRHPYSRKFEDLLPEASVELPVDVVEKIKSIFLDLD